ncbi:hypothetical protein [Dactylosporangium sp. CS-033363]|uniref:hypothetical protein n=1 Tax=Dactylosporangium sp. CS-033363 TaxID=3239935 RepID=UPI003D8EC5A3
MTRTTPPRPVDVAALVPELRDHTATATRLHPRPGAPGVGDSSVGGPLLWPAAEPWPMCPQDEGAMVPVAQLYRRDIPDFAGPDGSDLLQVLWCPLDHPDEGYNPLVRLVWRRAGDVAEVLADPPRPEEPEEQYVPEPCVVHPERVREYEYLGLLPPELRRRLARVDYQYDLSLAPGWKVGGFANWSLTDPHPVDCDVCGAGMTLLFTAASSEWQGRGTWRPVEEPEGARPVPTGVTIGRGYSLYVFRCPGSFDHPPGTAMQ